MIDGNKTSAKVRYITADIAKGICIILVVWGHVLANIGSTYSVFISCVHMPVFFFISGFFLAKENNLPLKDRITRKAKRLLIPYIMWSTVAFVMNALMNFSKLGRGQYNILAELIDIFVYSRSVWFLIELFISTLFLILIDWLTRNKNRGYFYITQLLLYLLFILLPINRIFMLYKSKWLYPFLLMGYSLRDHVDVFKPNKYVSVGGILSFAFIIVYCIAYGFSSNTYVEAFYDLSINTITVGKLLECGGSWLIGIIGLVFVLWVSQSIMSIKQIGKFLSNFGNYSLDIYVIHMFCIYILKAFAHPLSNNTLWLMVTLCLSVLICFAIFCASKYVLRRSALYKRSIGL